MLGFFVYNNQSFGINYKFYFGDELHYEGYTKINKSTIYNENSHYGYDLNTIPKDNNPYFFSIQVPEGNYKLTLTLGSKNHPTNTTVKSESRRLMLENVETQQNEFVEKSFVVNTRNIMIGDNDSVRIKEREIGKLNWDDKLTIEINGKNPGLMKLEIESISVPTIFLAGNSTVVDQSYEPWCGWGQILPRFLKSNIAVANYAESGESASSFISSKRLTKILTKIKENDYLFIEFGHNDQKRKGPNIGPFTSYKKDLEYFIDKVREKRATPILVTPMHRRSFDDEGKVINTLGEYPNAMKELANEKNVMLIDLNKMSRILYEAWGAEESKKAFVHYPAGTFPDQLTELKDNTHFNTYGGYQICKCIIKGLIDNDSPLKNNLVDDFTYFDPTNPDSEADFYIHPTPFTSIEKPEGN